MPACAASSCGARTAKLVVEGLKVERDGAPQEMRADVVVDATGRNTSFPEWLRAEGLTVRAESSPCGILYYTRHYKLRDGQDEPPRGGEAGGGDLGYIKFGVFIGDNRHFSVTLATPEIETEMRMAVMKPENFDAACMAMPGAARWVDPVRAEPVSKVYAMGELHNVWRHFLKDGEPQVLNFFALGDAAIRTNPLYGRGCSSGVVEAHLLRGALDATDDAVERAKIYERELKAQIRPYYDSMVSLDLNAIRRAEHERNPNYKPGLRARMTKSFTEDGLMPAQRGDVEVSRALSRVFHMLDEPTAFMKRPAIVARILAMWATPMASKKSRGLYPPKSGPDRAEMLALNIAACLSQIPDASLNGDLDDRLSRTDDGQDQRHRHGRLRVRTERRNSGCPLSRLPRARLFLAAPAAGTRRRRLSRHRAGPARLWPHLPPRSGRRLRHGASHGRSRRHARRARPEGCDLLRP